MVIEIRLQPQCRGVALLRFDNAVGPVIEDIFPKGFIPGELLWNLALDMWMTMGSKSMEEGYNTVVFLKDINLFACIISGGSSQGTPYALSAFFDPESIGGVWSIKDKIMRILSKHIERIRRGEGEAEQLVKDAYGEIVNISLGGKKDVFETFLNTTVEFISRIVSRIRLSDNDYLKGLFREYVEQLVDTAYKIGMEGVIKRVLIIKPFLEQ